MQCFQLCMNTRIYVHKTLQSHMQNIPLQIGTCTMLNTVLHICSVVVLISSPVPNPSRQTFTSSLHRDSLSEQQSVCSQSKIKRTLFLLLPLTSFIFHLEQNRKMLPPKKPFYSFLIQQPHHRSGIQPPSKRHLLLHTPSHSKCCALNIE